MARDSQRKRLPPYVSYRTFYNFIDRLQQGIPDRIDRSYWSERLSGSNGTQLMSALRFLGLIDTSGTPTSLCRQLVSAEGPQRTEVLRQITSEAYSSLLQGSLDSQTATYSQLEEAFDSTFELTESVRRKCIKFFVTLANDAGIPLSPFIMKRLRSARSGNRTKSVIRRTGSNMKRKHQVPPDTEEVPIAISWDKMLLAKFPTFDPSWSDGVKLGWLEAFAGLRFPTFNPGWSDEVKIKWFAAYDKLLGRDFPRGKE